MTKHFIIIVLGLFILNISCTQKKDEKSKASKGEIKDLAKIVFEKTNHDFGQINEGDVVSHTYTFKNMGSMPLQILSVDVTCGCTVADKPEEAIGLMQSGEIKIKFNSSGKSGINKKNITVTSNASNAVEILSFDVVVNNKENQK